MKPKDIKWPSKPKYIYEAGQWAGIKLLAFIIIVSTLLSIVILKIIPRETNEEYRIYEISKLTMNTIFVDKI